MSEIADTLFLTHYSPVLFIYTPLKKLENLKILSCFFFLGGRGGIDK